MKNIQNLMGYIAIMAIALLTTLSCKDGADSDKLDIYDYDYSFDIELQKLKSNITDSEDFELKWVDGSAVNMWITSYWSYTASDRKFITKLGGKPKAKFEGSVATREDDRQFTLYSSYPYNENISSDMTNLTVFISPQQTQNEAEPELMEKGFAVGQAQSENKLIEMPTVKMTFGATALKLNFDFANTMLEGKHVKQIKLTSSKSIVGGYKVDASDGYKTVIQPNGKLLLLDYPNQPEILNTAEGWIVITPNDYTKEEFTFEITTEERFLATIKYTPQIAYQACNAYLIDVNVEEFVAAGDAILLEPMENLSEKGGSNCYIVLESGKHGFKLTRGNSTAIITDEITKIDWLWMSEDDLIKDIKVEGDMITFRYNGAKGNAVIAGFNDADQIVWSWHIWATDDPTINTHFVSSAAHTLLDRNLGAISADADDLNANGFYYQWGRKDPFLSPNVFGSKGKREESTGFTTATQAYVLNPLYPTHAFGYTPNTTLTAGEEIDFLVANPTKYINNTYMSGGWANFMLAVDVAKYLNVWGYESSMDDNLKTIYDPCPVGYKVPGTSIKTWDGITLTNAPITTAIVEAPNSRTFTSGDGTQVGFYPAAGQRLHESGQVSYAGSFIGCWSSSPVFTNGTAAGLGNMTAYTLRIEAANCRANIRVGAANALSVRCVKE